MPKRRKPIVGTIETERDEYDKLIPHALHTVSLTHWYLEGMIQLYCSDCAKPLIEFVKEEEEDD